MQKPRRGVYLDGVLGVFPWRETGKPAASITVPLTHATIQEAVSAAVHGDIIEVQPGIYSENIDFGGKEIVLRSTDPDDPETVASTVIDGGRGGPAVTFQGGEGGRTALQGFTITGRSGAPVVFDYLYGEQGRGMEGCGGGGLLISGGSSPAIQNNRIAGVVLSEGPCGKNGVGAGIFIHDAAPSITGNTITGNSALRGGAIYITQASPVLSGNMIIGNEASWEGGGIYVRGDAPVTFEDNLLAENRAEKGGGLYISGGTVYIRNNSFSANRASYMGGGIYLERASLSSLSGNHFMQNRGEECGGALVVQGAAPRIEGNVFQENSAGWRGGGAVYVFDRAEPYFGGNTWLGNWTEAAEGVTVQVSGDSNPTFTDEAID